MHGWAIGQRFIPRIVTFLGYNHEMDNELIDSNCESIKYGLLEESSLSDKIKIWQ